MATYREANRTVEEHTECILRALVLDANGVPVPRQPVKVWAGQPPFWTADAPILTGATGLFEFIAVGGSMPENRDYYLQLLDPQTKQPVSDPIRCPFKKGEALWYILTLQPEGASTAGNSIPPVPTLMLDSRLLREVRVTVALAPVPPGQSYWKLISALYQDPEESGGNVNIVCYVQNEFGRPAVNQKVVQAFGTDSADGLTDGQGHIDFPMTGASSFSPDRGENGPYSAFVSGFPSDRVLGMGLPLRRHVQYLLTWRKVTAGDSSNPPVDLDKAARDAAIARKPWLAINTEAALYKFAQAKGLGYPQTDEFEFRIGGDSYLAQVFNLGIAYVKQGDWANIRSVAKPAGA